MGEKHQCEKKIYQLSNLALSYVGGVEERGGVMCG